MGNDWRWWHDQDEQEAGGKLKPGAIVLFIVLVIIGVVFVKCSPSTVDPKTLPNQPKQTVSSPVQVSPVPKVTPKPPTSQSLTFYVVSKNVPSYWGLDNVLAGWKLAKYSNFRQITACPLAAPCITISVTILDADTAAQATFGSNYGSLFIDLNPIVLDQREAQSALAHEFGHLLGAPHIMGTHNTVMNPIGVYQVLPTKLDIETVDRLGHWQIGKMAESSTKTVDVRSAPQ